MVRNAIALLAVALSMIFAQGCSRSGAGHERLRVVVTVQPLAEFVERVGGEKVAVAAMVPPGASPHTYEPRPSQLKEVSNADLFVKVGSNIEFELVWMDKLLKVNTKMPVVDCSAGVELIRAEKHEGGEASGHAAVDPHIWLSPKNARIMVENVYRGLAEADPDNKTYYAANKDAYLSEIDALDKEISGILSAAASRKVMVYHPAWAYLARDYGLEEIGIERGGKQATPAGIAEVVRLAKENGTTVVFASPEFSTRSAEVVAHEIGARVVLVSPLEREYIKNLKRVAEALAGR